LRNAVTFNQSQRHGLSVFHPKVPSLVVQFRQFPSWGQGVIAKNRIHPENTETVVLVVLVFVFVFGGLAGGPAAVRAVRKRPDLVVILARWKLVGFAANRFAAVPAVAKRVRD
jgi:hypothetical protein